MDTVTGRLEHAELNRCRGLAGQRRQVEQAAKGVGLRHVEVVASEHAEPPAAPENVL
jgi:hypothetical protein